MKFLLNGLRVGRMACESSKVPEEWKRGITVRTYESKGTVDSVTLTVGLD